MDLGSAALDEVAEELYDLPPEGFTAARRRAQEEARARGDRALAAAIGRLARPSTAAWVCNVLARERRAEVEGLVELGDLLREAQESLAGDQLRVLDRQRSQLLAALTRQATALARERGHRVSGPVETQVADTLRAALADPDAGAALLRGRLTGALSYSGLGTTGTRPDLRVVPPPDRPPRPPRSRAGDRRRQQEEAARRAAEEQRRRELDEARQALAEATAVAEETATAAEEEQRRADGLGARRAELQEQVAGLAAELARAEEEAARVAGDLERAERHRATVRRAATRAAAVRDRALERLRELEAAD